MTVTRTYKFFADFLGAVFLKEGSTSCVESTRYSKFGFMAITFNKVVFVIHFYIWFIKDYREYMRLLFVGILPLNSMENYY
jgi:hypothetical protein